MADPWYAAPPRAERGAPPPVHLAQYVEALARLASKEEAQLAGAPADDAGRWRVQELRAAVQRAERMGHAAGDRDAVRRLGPIQEAVESLASVCVPLTQSLPSGGAPRVTGLDEFWDDYLYAGLGAGRAEARDAPPRAPSPADEARAARHTDVPDDAELEAEYGSKAADAPPAADAAPEAHAPTQIDGQVRDALSSELLRMAGVLKRNTAAFGDALERDRVLVEQAGTRLDQNLSLMTRTRGQLGVFSKKARSMGWFTLTSMAMVFVSWVMMYIVIRLT